jgi:large subunit ribosomal protein L25
MERAMISDLKILERKASGKKEARKLRHEGFIPGIIYGDNKEPMKVAIGEKELASRCCSLAFLGHVIEVNFGSSVEKVLPKSIDLDPVTDRPIHVDFQRVSKNSRIKVNIPVEVANESKCPGIKKGGVVNLVVRQLECMCSPESIPEKIILDLSDKDIGDNFLLESIALPEGVFAINSKKDAVLATIVAVKTTEDTQTSAETSEGTSTSE